MKTITQYLDNEGIQISRQVYYERLITVAQQQQRKFPRWSSARRRWKGHERRYRALAAQAGGA